ncbi:hypothetical protein [Corynebacterium auriscanis]
MGLKVAREAKRARVPLGNVMAVLAAKTAPNLDHTQIAPSPHRT